MQQRQTVGAFSDSGDREEGFTGQRGLGRLECGRVIRIDECRGPLNAPMTILYGLNAAGKSHILKALADGMSAVGVLSILRRSGRGGHQAREVSIWIDPTTPALLEAYDTGGWSPWQASP